MTDRNYEISASIIRRYGDIAIANLENASKSIERYVVIGSSECRTASILRKIGDGDPKDEHAAAKARVERLREERIADGVEEANKFIQVVKDQAERMEKEVNVVKERVEMMRNMERLIGEIIEGAGEED